MDMEKILIMCAKCFGVFEVKFPLFIKDNTIIPKRTPTNEEPKTAGHAQLRPVFKGKGKPYDKKDSKGAEKHKRISNLGV